MNKQETPKLPTEGIEDFFMICMESQAADIYQWLIEEQKIKDSEIEKIRQFMKIHKAREKKLKDAFNVKYEGEFGCLY